MPKREVRYVNTPSGSVPPSGWTRLCHGTSLDAVECILEFGVSAEQARKFGSSGAFHTSESVEVATWYARLSSSESPAILIVDLPQEDIDYCVEKGWVEDHWMDKHLEFHEPAHRVLNQNMTIVEVVVLD